MSEVPELLTIDEAARVMGVSRNTAYKEAQRFRATNGKEGLEFVDAAGQMRVPRRRLEKKLRITIDHIRRRRRARPRAPRSHSGEPQPPPLQLMLCPMSRRLTPNERASHQSGTSDV